MQQNNDDILQLVLQANEIAALQNAQLHQQLSAYINHLINNDFAALVQLLYRIDVSEAKLKLLFAENKNEDAGDIIASLVIQRQLQKIETRKMFQQENGNGGEEKW